jgi:hypothetical protein
LFSGARNPPLKMLKAYLEKLDLTDKKKFRRRRLIFFNTLVIAGDEAEGFWSSAP